MFGKFYPKLLAQHAIRKLFYDTLKAPLRAQFGCEVYDNAPKDIPLPYVKIGDFRMEPIQEEDKDFYIDNCWLSIDVRTFYGGSMLCATIIDELVSVISRACLAGTFCFGASSPFRISDFEIVMVQQTTAVDDEEEQGFVQYGIQIVQIVPTA